MRVEFGYYVGAPELCLKTELCSERIRAEWRDRSSRAGKLLGEYPVPPCIIFALGAHAVASPSALVGRPLVNTLNGFPGRPVRTTLRAWLAWQSSAAWTSTSPAVAGNNYPRSAQMRVPEWAVADPAHQLQSFTRMRPRANLRPCRDQGRPPRLGKA